MFCRSCKFLLKWGLTFLPVVGRLVQSHVRRCASCRRRQETYAELDKTLRQQAQAEKMRCYTHSSGEFWGVAGSAEKRGAAEDESSTRFKLVVGTALASAAVVMFLVTVTMIVYQSGNSTRNAWVERTKQERILMYGVRGGSVDVFNEAQEMMAIEEQQLSKEARILHRDINKLFGHIEEYVGLGESLLGDGSVRENKRNI